MAVKISNILLLSLERKAIVILCILFIIFSLCGCGSDLGNGEYKGWISVDDPDSSPVVVENIDRIQITGRVFQSPVGGVENDEFVFALNVTVTNLTTDFAITASLSQPEIWSAVVPLAFGENLIEAYVEDSNGVSASVQILVERVDTIPPAILSRSPAVNAVNVATNTDVNLIFSEPLESSSINLSSISLSRSENEIEGTISYDDDANELVFSPSVPLLNNTSYTVRINSDITDINGTSVIASSWKFATIPMSTIPTVQTEEATNVGETAATLWGSVYPNYADTEAWFEWGEITALGAYSTTEKTYISAVSGNSKLSSNISLNPAVNYFYRIVASNSAGLSKGDIRSFYTPGPPTVITSPPLLSSPYQVKLIGSVNPNGYETESSFKISFDHALGEVKDSSSYIQVGDGHNFIGVDHVFDQLASGTKYYYRLDANYPNGTTTNGVFSIVTPYSTSSCWAKRYHPPASILVGAENEIGFDEITSIDQTLDDGYIIIMESLSYEDGLGGTRGMRILKTNSDGGVEWVRRYSTSSNHKVGYNISTIRQTSTGNYIVAGYHQTGWSLSHSTEVTWIAELDQNGETVWENRYGDTYYSRDSNWYRPTNIFLLSDGYIVFGTYYGTYEGTSTWMMKLDTDGEPVWSQSYYGSNSVITRVPDGFVMARVNGHDMIVTWLDQYGQAQKSKQYGTSLDLVKSIAVSSDVLAIVGKVTNTDNTSDIRVFGIEANGDISWEYIIDGGYDDTATSIHATSDGGFIIGGNSGINESDEGVLLLKMSLSGTLQWQKAYPDKSIPNNHDTLRPVTGGDYIVGVRSVPSQVNTFELIKTDSSGSCSTLDSPSLIAPSLSESTITDYTESSGSGDPTYLWSSTSYLFDGYVKIEQFYP